MTPSHDLDLERELLGSVLLHPAAIDDVAAVVSPSDFYSPAHASAFAACIALRDRGDDPTDARLVVDEVKSQGFALDPRDVVGWLVHAPASWRTRAAKLAEHRLRRDLLVVSGAAAEAAESGDPVGAVDDLRARLDLLNRATTDMPADVECSAHLADEAVELEPWVIPGLLRRQDRCVVVGFEGHGKTVLLDQVSWCASQGLHPFHRRAVEPIVALKVDLENSKARVQLGYRPLVRLCQEMVGSRFDEARHFTWRRPQGIDIRSRRNQAELEAIIRTLRPDLVCIGPLRKTYRRRPQENDEASSLDVQWHFDQLRIRYGFALLIEHHAPHTDSGFGGRKPRPFGSSTWLGWSEFGYGMTPDEKRPGVYALDRWRLDRTEAEWPDEIHRGQVWPWDGYREHGWGSWESIGPLREAG